MAPAPNPRVLGELGRADAVVYGMGSLYTSIAPSLILQGMGEVVAQRSCPKVGKEGGCGPLAVHVLALLGAEGAGLGGVWRSL